MASKRGLRSAALVLAGTAVGLLLGEAALRLFAPQPTGVVAIEADPDLVERLAPSSRGRVTLPGVFSFAYAHDRHGRRETGTSGDLEVLVLGDSFAYGLGVDDDETVAAQLGGVLRARDTPVEVANAGVPGVGPAYALRLLQTHGAAWRPDAAVYLFYPNDFVNAWQQTLVDLEGDALAGRVPDEPWRQRRVAVESRPLYRALRTHSHVASLLWRAAVVAVGAPGGANTDADTTGPARPWSFPDAERRTLRLLEGVRDELGSRGVPLVLAYAPTAAELADARRGAGPSADLQAFRRMQGSLGLDAVDLTPVLRGRPESVGDLYFPETHWRPVAHGLAARALADPVQAALCAQDLSRPGCSEAPPDVRRIAETRARGARGGPSRRRLAD